MARQNYWGDQADTMPELRGRKKKKKKRNRLETPELPSGTPDPAKTPTPGLGGGSNSMYGTSGGTRMPGISPGLGSGTTYGTAKGQTSQGSGQYGGAIRNQEIYAAPGSIAATLSKAGGLGSLANHPMDQIDTYYNQKSGLGPGSNSAQLAGYYFDPSQKVFGILGGNELGNNIEVINFGEALMDEMSHGSGAQLNPKSMMQTLLSTIAHEASTMSKGGDAAEGDFNPLAEIAHNPDPSDAMNTFLSMVRGVLQGTMPNDTLESYLGMLKRVGQSFAMEWRTNDPDRMESQGQNIATYIMSKLGPTAGL